MKVLFRILLAMLILFSVSCQNGRNREAISSNIENNTIPQKYQNTNNRQLTNYMTDAERKSVKFSGVSRRHKYYNFISDIAKDIQEMSVYDEELRSTYIIHIALPPGYDENKSYPMFIMTDGLWRMMDHAGLRPMIVNGEVEDIILASIGYNYGVEADKVEVRFVEFVQKSDLFLGFITNNLAPYLEELYNIDFERSALMGHSLGGLFTYYAVFSHFKYLNQPFKYYVMASPSFFALDIPSYWRYGDIEKVYFLRNETLEKQIYLVAGDNEGFDDTLANIERFLQRSKQNGVTTIDYEIFEGDHSNYIGRMLRKALLKWYSKGK